MALPKVYSTGTVSVANGATAVTGVGTAWLSAVAGDDVFRRAGHSVRVASVVDDEHITLAEPWPGTSLVASAYEIAITYDGPEFQLKVRQYLDLISQVENTGIGIDAYGLLADRDDYDDEYLNFAGTRFVYWSVDGDGGSVTTPVAYIKASAVSGDWDGPYGTTGPIGLTGLDGADALTEGLTEIVTASGTKVVSDTVRCLIFNLAAPGTVDLDLGSVDDRAGASLKLTDWAGNVTLTGTPDGAEKLQGVAGSAIPIGASGGQGIGLALTLTLFPNTSLNGWFV